MQLAQSSFRSMMNCLAFQPYEFDPKAGPPDEQCCVTGCRERPKTEVLSLRLFCTSDQTCPTCVQFERKTHPNYIHNWTKKYVIVNVIFIPSLNKCLLANQFQRQRCNYFFHCAARNLLGTRTVVWSKKKGTKKKAILHNFNWATRAQKSWLQDATVDNSSRCTNTVAFGQVNTITVKITRRCT